MEDQKSIKEAKDSGGEALLSPRPAPHGFQSMHGTNSCWHCDRRVLDPIHIKDGEPNEATVDSDSRLATSK